MANRFAHRLKTRLAHDRWALLNGVLLGCFLLTALLAGAGWLGAAWNDKVGPSFVAPCLQYPLGTDFLGRSVVQKLIFGAKISVAVSLIGATISLVVGALIGMLGGYLGGWVDDLTVWCTSTISSVPGILMMCSVAFVLQDAQIAGVALRGIPAMALALGLTHWIGTSRLVRSEILRQRHCDYVAASEALGASRWQVLSRHLLPQVLHLLLYEGFLHCVAFIRAEVMLSFLGLGPADQTSWGIMLDDARFELGRDVWWPMLSVTVLVLLFSCAVHYVGEVFRDECGGAPKKKNWARPRV